MESTKKCHLTINDNETGKVERDLDTGIIIGAADVDEETTAVFSFICGSCSDVLTTLLGAEEAIEKTYKSAPKLRPLKPSTSRASTSRRPQRTPKTQKTTN